MTKSQDTYLAVWKDECSDEPAAPKDTPTARPSGILCTVIATTRSIIRFHCDCRASNCFTIPSRRSPSPFSPTF